MSETCETVRVKSPATDKNPHGYIVINLDDLGNEHELFDKPSKQEKLKV
jgi:hypothetical protein